MVSATTFLVAVVFLEVILYPGELEGKVKRSSGCDKKCFEACPSPGEQKVCGSNGKVYKSVCRMECCGVKQANNSTCNHKLSKAASLISNPPAKQKKITRGRQIKRRRNSKSHKCSRKCMQNCTDDIGQVCGSDGRIYANSCRMKCCAASQTDWITCITRHESETSAAPNNDHTLTDKRKAAKSGKNKSTSASSKPNPSSQKKLKVTMKRTRIHNDKKKVEPDHKAPIKAEKDGKKNRDKRKSKRHTKNTENRIASQNIEFL